MALKHCQYCRKLFISQSQGLPRIFCQACTHACDQAYLKIRRYLQDHPNAPAAKIVIELGVPATFVHQLFQLGRLTPALQTRSKKVSSSAVRPCALCHRVLKTHENVYCTVCDDVIEKRLHSRHANTPTTSLMPGPAPYPIRRPPQPNQHHQGFGKSI